MNNSNFVSSKQLFPLTTIDSQTGNIVRDERYLNREVILRSLYQLQNALKDKNISRSKIIEHINNMITGISA